MPLEQPKWHYNNYSKLKLKKENKTKKTKKKDSINQMCTVGAFYAPFYIANRIVATTLALHIYTFVMKVLWKML